MKTGKLIITSEELDELDCLLDNAIESDPPPHGIDLNILKELHKKVMDLLDVLNPKKSVDLYI
tara:strand:- start:1697 stop:1885 length:189 start_codon:yes stop_codon:yes gene_type:complete